MEVRECGTKAKTVIGGIEGIITAVLIRFVKVQYELAYFDKGKRHSEWVEECELEYDASVKRKTIGYK